MISTRKLGAAEFAVHAGDMGDTDGFRAGGLTLIFVGAVAEALGIHLLDHADNALARFDLPLRQ